MTLPDDDVFLDEVFDLAVHRHALGEPLELTQLLSGREHLRARIVALLELAQDVAPMSPACLPGDLVAAVTGFTILREAGRGGMGIVYHARQHSLDRPVALKILAPELMASPRARERFLSEARALARVSHPHVVQVHAVIEEPAVSAYAMEWVEGRTLAKAIASNEPVFDVRAAAVLGANIARALCAVHGADLVHRDVKPGNVLLRGDGQALLADFGLARDAKADLRIAEGEFAGTTAYAAPEQLRGEQDKVGAWTDIYSLGATLYHLLAGKLPIAPCSPAVLLRRIESGEWTPLRRLKPEVPHDLDAIITKAMAREPKGRYATAADLGDDLERFLRFEPVRARPVNVRVRLARWMERHPQLAFALAALFVCLVVGLTVSLHFLRQAQAARTQAEQREYSACIAAAEAAWRAQDGSDAQAHLARAPQELRHWEWSYMQARSQRSRVLCQHDNRVNSMAARPNGTQMATASQNGSVCIWDADVPGQRQKLAHDGPVWGVAWRSDGAFLVSATEVTLYVWDSMTWTVHARYRLAAPGRTLAFSQDARLLAVGHADGSIGILRSRDLIGPSASKERPRLPAPQLVVSMGSSVHEVRFSPHGWFAATSGPGLLVWDLLSGRELCRFPLGLNSFGLAVHPDGNRVAAGTNDGRIGIFDVKQRREVAMIPAHDGRVMALTWLADGSRLLSAGADRSIRAWSNSGAQVDVMVGHISGLVGLAVLGDGRVVSAGSTRNASDVRVWDGTCSAVMLKSPHGYHSIRVTLDPRGIWFAWSTATRFRSYVAVGHLAAPNLQGGTLLELPGATPLPMAVSPDGMCLAVGTSTGVSLYSSEVVTALGAVASEPTPSPFAKIAARDVEALAFGPTSAALAIGSADGTVAVWDTERGRALRALALSGGAIHELSFSADGEHLAAATSSHAVIFDLVSGERVVEWSDLRDCGGLAFSPDGEYLALAHRLEQPVITLWNRTSASVQAVLHGHNGHIHALAFSPDGHRLASGSVDHTVRLWDPHSGMAAATLHDHSYLVRCVAWSSDGAQLVSSSADGVLWFRRAPGSLVPRK